MSKLIDKQLQVSAIENGTVLDHITADKLFKVIEILELEKIGGQITFGTNLDSKLLGKKAIIKISDKYFKDDEINRIALIAPQAKINIIRDYEVIEKRVISLPEEIRGIVKCANPMCVTNHQRIETRFTTLQTEDSVLLKCHFCEKVTNTKNII